jgi:hypothetical protein
MIKTLMIKIREFVTWGVTNISRYTPLGRNGEDQACRTNGSWVLRRDPNKLDEGGNPPPLSNPI